MENGNTDKSYKIKLIRGAKGKYRWEITVSLDDRNQCVLQAEVMDDDAKIKWGDVSE